MSSSPKYNGFHHVVNTHILDLKEDILHHIGLTFSEEKKQQMIEIFGDIKFFVTGGSAERMARFAHSVADALNIKTPYGYALTPIGSTSRYVVYKVGPVLIANHGMGMPSISILLHEVTKLLEYAKVKDAIYIRMGTSGGIGVEGGTVIFSSEGVNHKMESIHEVPVLGGVIRRPAILDVQTTQEIAKSAKELQIPFVIGKTLTCDDFYEGQGRLDGAICEYTLEDKMAFLHKCSEAGVKNIEMEARGFAAFCYKLQIPAAVVCVALMNRLYGDQVTSTKATLIEFEDRPAAVLLNFIKKKMTKQD